MSDLARHWPRILVAALALAALALLVGLPIAGAAPLLPLVACLGMHLVMGHGHGPRHAATAGSSAAGPAADPRGRAADRPGPPRPARAREHA